MTAHDKSAYVNLNRSTAEAIIDLIEDPALTQGAKMENLRWAVGLGGVKRVCEALLEAYDQAEAGSNAR